MTLISGSVYYYYGPYKSTLDLYLRYKNFDEGLTAQYSLERTVASLLPRVDLYRYQQQRGYSPSQPVVWTFPFQEGETSIRLESLNNCLNVTSLRSTRLNNQHDLSALMLRLSERILKNKEAGLSVLQILHAAASARTESSRMRLKTSERHNLEGLSPYLCRRKNAPQKINVNAITESSLPVLEAVLSPYIENRSLDVYWQHNKMHYWQNPHDFFKTFSFDQTAENNLSEMFVTEDEEIMLTITFKLAAGTAFYSESHFYLHDGKAMVYSRKFYDDDAIR